MKTPLSKTVPAFAGCFLAALFGVINLVGQDENGGDEPTAPEGEVAGEPDGEGTEPEPEENEPAGPGAGEQPGGPGERPGGPGGRPGGPGGRPGGPGAAVPDTVTLQFPNNPVTDLLGIYERLTSKTIIKDTSIFEGANISLVTPKPVPKDEAIRLIESSLLLNGYALISQPDGESVKILPTRGGGGDQPAFSEGLKMYRDAAELPKGETVISYFMHLDYLDPAVAGSIFSNHVGLNPYGRITPVISPPGLLITENAAIVRQLVNIQAIIDVEDQATSIVTEFIELEHADATTVAQILQASLDARREAEESGETISAARPQTPRAGGGDQRRPDGGGNNNNAGGNNRGGQDRNQAIPDPPAQLIADDRLNRIMVVATTDDFLYLRSLISEFDQPIPVEKPLEWPLNYAYSLDLLPVLADILQDAGTGASTVPGGGAVASRGQPRTSSSVTSLTGRSGTDRTPDVTSSNADRPDQIEQPEEDTAPVSVLVGKTRIIADPQANTIIALGPEEDLQKIEMLLTKLDRKPPQVYLATIIGKLQLGDEFEFGVDYLQKFTQFTSSNPDRGGIASSLLTGRTDVVDNLNVADVRDSIITTPFGPAAALNVYGQIGRNLDAFITALETTNRFKVLSRPSVYALNNKKAVITSGQRIPVPATSLTNASSGGNVNDNGNVTTTIEYEDVVLKLEVVPMINSDKEVTLTVAQVNDTVTGETVVAQNIIPIIGTEELSTTVTIPNQTTVVLGGLITEQKTESVSGVPILSKIPILGVPFRTTKTDEVRSELIIFIQPIVVTDNDELQAASYSEDIRTDIGADAYEKFPTARPYEYRQGPSGQPIPVIRAVPLEEENLAPAPLPKPSRDINSGPLRHPLAPRR